MPKSSSIAALWLAVLAVGCVAGSAPLDGDSPAATAAPGAAAASGLMPIVLDRADLRLGTTVQFDRIPRVGELYDQRHISGLQRIVVALPEWPREYAEIEPLGQLPSGIELMVVLTGYPPSRSAAAAWNYLRVPLRIVLVVDGPPRATTPIDDLNEMRALERVIARMDFPARSGFERLQRPISFLKVVP